MSQLSDIRILVVDDEELIRWALCEHLRAEGYQVSEAVNGALGLEAAIASPPDLMLLDLRMPEMGGIEVLRALRARDGVVSTLVLTADGTVDSAVEATQLGARGYLTKPFELDDVSRAVARVLDEDRAAREVVYDAKGSRPGYGDYIGGAAVLRPVFATLRRLEQVDAPTVLVLGESGTGKDVVARMIHARGPRRRGPFLDIDCAALPPALIESELFGHEKGAFTDARETKRGLFEAARGGVVFLDEIGELPVDTQVKLLRALESRTYRRVGGLKPLELDAAIVAATNRDLTKEVAAGRFREDLYFRLAVVPIRLPALRERRDDVPALVAHFIDRCNSRFGREISGVSAEAMSLLQRWTWPGNVRELRNVVERIAILSSDDVVRVDALPPEIRYARVDAHAACPFELPASGIDLVAVEKGLVMQALQRAEGDAELAAALLGISAEELDQRKLKLQLVAT